MKILVKQKRSRDAEKIAIRHMKVGARPKALPVSFVAMMLFACLGLFFVPAYVNISFGIFTKAEDASPGDVPPIVMPDIAPDITLETVQEAPAPELPAPEPEIPAAPALMEKPSFTQAEQSLVQIKPRFADGSTNIAFYIPYEDQGWIWQSETPAIGTMPFVDYWGPTPAPGKYVVVEYANDNQQFSCSDLALDNCLSDPHFISKFDFEISE